NLEARLEKFRPQLPVVRGEADILLEDALVVVADVLANRQGRHRFGSEIGAIARGETKGPHLVRPETDPPDHRRMIEVHSGARPRLGPRRERGVFDFRRVIELAEASRYRNARGVA